jgi:8-oxo-dGTP pyrophosphatase MutT (NUDIX family)
MESGRDQAVSQAGVRSRERSCGAIVFREIEGIKRVLLVQHGPGHWSFPKGHVEPGENDHQTAIREVLEETGIQIAIRSDFQRSSTYSPRPGVLKTVVFFLGVYLGGNLKPQLTEVRQAAWVKLEEAGQLLIFDRDLEIYQEALTSVQLQAKE